MTEFGHQPERRLIPSFFILACSVVRFRPRIPDAEVQNNFLPLYSKSSQMTRPSFEIRSPIVSETLLARLKKTV
jgi:hypothetical protein